MSVEAKPAANTPEEAAKNTNANGGGAGTQTGKTEGAPKFTQEEHQAEIDRIAAKVRAEEKQKHDTANAEADRKRQEAADKEAGKHKDLAEKFERERDAANVERDDFKGKYESLAEKVKTSVAAEIKLLPPDIAALAPSETNLDARLEWLPKAKKTAETLSGETKPGNSRGPKPMGATPHDAVADIVARKRQSGQYSR